jgi:hypothetical protein
MIVRPVIQPSPEAPGAQVPPVAVVFSQNSMVKSPPTSAGGMGVDPHLDPVDIAHAVAVELERIATRRLRLRVAQPGVGEQRKKPARRNKKDKRN